MDNPFAGTSIEISPTTMDAVQREEKEKANERVANVDAAIEQTTEVEHEPQEVETETTEEEVQQQQETEEETPTTEKANGEEGAEDDDPEFDATDFEESDDSGLAKSKEEIKAEEEARQEQRAADQEASTSVRNYDGFSPGEIEVFKKMSTHAFNTVRSSLLEAKEVPTLREKIKKLEEGGLPPSYLEHPEAYKLTPEFSQAQKNLEGQSQLYNFYYNQLAAIKEGQNYKDFAVGADGKLVMGQDGKPVFVDKEPTSLSEMEIQQKLMQVNQNISSAQSTLQNAQNNYKTALEQNKHNMESVFNQFFPSYVKEEEALKNQDFKYMHEALNKMGASHNTLRKPFAALYAEIKKRDKTISDLKGKLGDKSKVAAVARRNGPSSKKLVKADKVNEEDRVFDVTKEFEDV